MNYCVAIRRLAQLSQRELATRIGVSQPMISAIETGRRQLPDVRRRQLERLLSAPTAPLSTPEDPA